MAPQTASIPGSNRRRLSTGHYMSVYMRLLVKIRFRNPGYFAYYAASLFFCALYLMGMVTAPETKEDTPDPHYQATSDARPTLIGGPASYMATPKDELSEQALAFLSTRVQWMETETEVIDSLKALDDDEIAALRDEYLDYVEEALKLRDDLAAATGYEGTSAQEQQSATQGYSTTMTQDQASELTGRFTAFNESALRIESKIDIGNVNLETVKNHVAETRDIIQSCYGELLQISENTGAIIQPIQQIQKDIAKVRENTARI